MAELNGRLAALWTELPRCEEVTADTDFFTCGGTSIVAVYLAAEIQENLRVEVDAAEVITHPTFGALASLVNERLLEEAA
ncbi:phosphopantetheine-binding protein [Kitasatospora sp. NPDC002543]